MKYALIALIALAFTACSGNQLKAVSKDMCGCMMPYVEADKAWEVIAQDTTIADDIRLSIARERMDKRTEMEQCMSALEMKYSNVSFSGKGEQLQELLQDRCPDAFNYFGLRNEVGE